MTNTKTYVSNKIDYCIYGYLHKINTKPANIGMFTVGYKGVLARFPLIVWP